MVPSTFPDQPINTTSAPSNLRISNSGTANLVVTGIDIAGSTAFMFAGSPVVLPLTVSPGSSVTMPLTFMPTAIQSYNGSITIASNASSAPTVIPLSGKGIQSSGGNISLNTTSLVFPGTNLNTASSSKPIVISTTGNGNLVVSSVTITGDNASDFSFTGPAAPFTVWQQSSTVIGVTFKPTASGARSATLTLVDNAPGSPHTIMLSGVGQ